MLRRMLRKLFPGLISLRRDIRHLLQFYDMELDKIVQERQLRHPNKLARYGKKCFSQTDEDGITLEILRRLDIESGTFAEFGVGDGTENNTLVLLALGWKGFWVGGEELAFNTGDSDRIVFQQSWITRENITPLFKAGLTKIGAEGADVVSLDLDGNDLFFCEALLSGGARPSLFIVEYNAKFPPPIRFSIEYDATHRWTGDDYQGASLMSFCDLFGDHGYSLICCNAATGANAFFVRNEFVSKFPEVPEETDDIYSSPHFFLYGRYGHKLSIKTIETIIR